ncbi:MAG: aminotransferase class I/II-fold pyridoxal phosphate-dependent enzyme [Thermoplasmataceae archaeon]
MSNQTPIRETVDPPRFSLTFPIYQTSAFKLPEGEKYRYGREGNPTVEELQRIISEFENSEETVCFSSGMGAIVTTLLTLIKPGQRLIMPIDTFARTSRFARDFLAKWGVDVRIVSPGTEPIISEISKGCVVFVETISNPILRVYDIHKLSKEVHSADGLLITDSTFATPVNCSPVKLGSDVDIHSLSKFIGGHNDLIGGSASGNFELLKQIDLFRRTLGTSMDPNTAFLAIRGIKTLKLRMEKINENANEVAKQLSKIDQFKGVSYPGLPSHPDFQIASRILKGYGGVVTFRKNNFRGIEKPTFEGLRLVIPANTLGNITSIISHPATMSHRSLEPKEMDLLGIDGHTFRLSVGIEDPDMIVEDILNL